MKAIATRSLKNIASAPYCSQMDTADACSHLENFGPCVYCSVKQLLCRTSPARKMLLFLKEAHVVW